MLNFPVRNFIVNTKFCAVTSECAWPERLQLAAGSSPQRPVSRCLTLRQAEGSPNAVGRLRMLYPTAATTTCTTFLAVRWFKEFEVVAFLVVHKLAPL